MCTVLGVSVLATSSHTHLQTLLLADRVLSDYAEFCYKVTDFYHPNDEGGLMWNDPDIGVEWPMPKGMTAEDLILSEKDKVNSSFKEYKKNRQ